MVRFEQSPTVRRRYPRLSRIVSRRSKHTIGHQRQTVMNVRELIARLSAAPSDATVLLLPQYGDVSDIDQLASVVVPRAEWRHERQRNSNGTSTDVYHPGVHTFTIGFNEGTDDAWTERVVVLSPDHDLPDALLVDDGAIERGGISLRTKIREEALHARRAMITNGDLLTENELRTLLGFSEDHLANLVSEGSVFPIIVDGQPMYPRLFCDRRLNLKHLQEIAKIIVPAPADSRLHFLTSCSAALGNRVPLDMLQDHRDFKSLRRHAAAWAIEYSRTTVSFYDGNYDHAPLDIKAIYTCVVDVDFRRPLWSRALKALVDFNYEWPCTAPLATTHFSISVQRERVGYADSPAEAWIQIGQSEERVHVFVEVIERRSRSIYVDLPRKGGTVKDVARRVFETLSER